MRSLHLLAWITCLCALPLISIGGLVTSTGAGLAVPDWPNSFGYNMFALPWNQWLGAHAYQSGVFQEHTHRLLGTVVGFTSIALCAVAWWRGNATLKLLTSLLLAAVIVQGLIGGFRVTEHSRLLSFLHGVFGQVVFAFAAVVVLLSGRWWLHAPQQTGGRWPVRLAMVGLGLVVMQLLLGAAMRHDGLRNHLTGAGAGLAVPDWPTHYGGLIPPTSAAGLAEANAERAALDLPPTTLHHIWLHMAHRLGAYVTATVLLTFTVVALRHRHRFPLLVGGLVLVQVTLGVLTVLYRKPADIATTHQAVGAILLAITTVATLRLWRVYRPTQEGFEPLAATQRVAV